MDCAAVWAPFELSVFTSSISAVTAIVAILSNLLIVIAVIWDPLKKLHTPFNYFLVNISASDLVTGLVVMPLSVASHYMESQKTINDSTRVAIRISFLIAATASTLCIIALSADRYAAIRWAVKYRQYLNYIRCIVVSGVIWVLAVSLPFLYFLMGYRNYLLFHANISLILGVGFLLALYVRVYLFLRGHTNELKRNLRISSTAAEEFHLKRMLMEKKVTRTFLVILFIYIVTYLPAVVLIYTIFFCDTCSCEFIHVIRDLQFVLVAINSCVNPFVCTLRLKHFSKSIHAILGRRQRNRIGVQSTIKMTNSKSKENVQGDK